VNALPINDDQLRALISGAILSAIGPEQRDAMLTEAIKHLMTPAQDGYYGKTMTPIQRAFNDAASAIASKHFAAMMEADIAFQERLKGMLAEAMERLFTVNREKVITAMVTAVQRGMERE
jgi:hypothetical protein